MKTIFEKIYRSEKVLVVVGLLFFVVGGVLAYGVAGADEDGDGVDDSRDICTPSVIDQPAKDLTVSHYVWVGGDRFMELVPNKRDKDKVMSEFSMVQTGGCSCADILARTGGKTVTGGQQNTVGCGKGVIESWISNKSSR